MELNLQEIIESDCQSPIGFQPSVDVETTEWNNNMYNQSICFYIHIPFCEQKCSFCGLFSKVDYTTQKLHQYTDAIIREIKQYSNKILINKKIEAIHFGGGTPSLLDVEDINRIIQAIYKYCDVSILKEIVLESNPASLNEEKILQYEKIDKIKLNMGIQSFDSVCLETIKRKSDQDHIKQVILQALNSKINSVGIDLIYGLPNSSLESCLNDVKNAVCLGIDYITLYPLWIEKNTILEKQNKKHNDNNWINYNNRKEMLVQMSNILLENGYLQLSSYHWSKKGLPNYIYSQRQMEGNSWLGIGAGAVSYLDGLSFNNTYDIDSYIKEPFEENYIIEKVQLLDFDNRLARDVAYGLRLMPFKLEVLRAKYGKHALDYMYNLMKNLERSGFLIFSDNEIRLSYDGILSLNYIEKYIMEKK